MDNILLTESIWRKAGSLPEKEAKQLEEITAEFISEAVTSKKDPEDWLKKKFKKKKLKDGDKAAEEIAAHIDICENNLRELDDHQKNGGTRESWLEKTIDNGSEMLGDEKVIAAVEIVAKIVKESNEAILETTVSEAKSSANQTGNGILKNEKAIKTSAVAQEICKNIGISAAIAAVCSGASKYTEIRQEQIAGAKTENAAAKIITESVKGASASTITIAIAGAVKYAAQNGIISSIPRDISGTACSSVAFSAVEQVKIAYMTACGEITASEAIEKSADAAVVCVGGIIGAEAASKGVAVLGAKIGGFTGALFGPGGAAVGVAVGGAIGRICGTILGKTAGVRIGQMISYGRKCIAKAAVDLFKEKGEKMAKTADSIKFKKAAFA